MAVITRPADKYVTVNGMRVRYWEAGSGRPLVCIHGLGVANSVEQYLGNLEAFSKIAHVYAIDLPGWGLSQILADGYSFPMWIETIRAFCDAMKLETIDIMGQSLGGWISALFAYEHPERVRRVVLNNNAGLNPQPPGSTGNFQMPTLESLKRTNEEPLASEIYARMQEPGRDSAYRALLKYVTNTSVREQYNLRSRLPRMQMPILFVQSDDNQTVGVQYAFEGFWLAPLGRLVVTLGPTGGGARGYGELDRAAVAFLTAEKIISPKYRTVEGTMTLNLGNP